MNRSLALALALACAAPAARAEGIEWQDVGLFAAGFGTAFAAHESGHALANLLQGNVPHIESVEFAGFLPFFAVAPDITCPVTTCFKRDGTVFGGGRRGLAVILLAGFNVQHLTDEALLTAWPDLRLQRAPYRDGILAFNTVTSIAYGVANLVGIEPSSGDLAGAVRDARVSRTLAASTLLGIAALDVLRWTFPDVGWLAWASRAAKVAFLGIPLTV